MIPRYGFSIIALRSWNRKGFHDRYRMEEKEELYESPDYQLKACYACMETHSCVIKDDMEIVFSKLVEADIIVLASPVYFYSVSAQNKAMIDRCLVGHKSIAGKKFYFIVTAADPQHEAAEGTLAAFRGFIRCLPDAQEKGVIYGMGTWDKGDVYRHPSYEQAYKMGKEI